MTTKLARLQAIEEADSTVIHNYPMPLGGINLYSNVMLLKPYEALQTQNSFVRSGLKTRFGSIKIDNDEVNAGDKILELHRFYYGADNKQLVVASDTDIRWLNSGTWTAIDTGQTADKSTLMNTWGAVDKLFICNGTNPGVTWDGSSAADMSGTNVPTDPIQVLPYRDRLLVIATTNPGELQWSASYDDTGTWETRTACGVKPDSKLYGMVLHTDSNSDQGVESKVLLGGANGMHLFSGTDIRTPFTTGNYRVESLATSVGCNAPKTMQWTPEGTMYLGRDRMVYMLPFKSNTPVPVGHKITSRHPAYEGIEQLPAGQIENACATYHDGFYKLSFAGNGQTTNNVQFWLDMNNVHKDEQGLYGPWFGPMTGQTISCFANYNGPGDVGELVGGESNPSTGSYVYTLHGGGVFNDDSTAISMFLQTFYHPLADPNMKDAIHMLELELLDTSGTLSIEFHDITGAIKTGDSITLGEGGIYWDDFYWGDFYWNGDGIERKKLNIGKSGGGTSLLRRCSIKIAHGVSTDTFELYNMNLKTIPQNIGFD